MVVEVAVLADYANVADGGKLNIMGVFDRITSPTLPAGVPTMVVALRLRLEFQDGSKSHAIRVYLRDEDGHHLIEGQGEVKSDQIPAGQSRTFSLALPFPNLQFPRYGEYSFVLSWNGEEAARIPFTVVQGETLPPAQPPTQ